MQKPDFTLKPWNRARKCSKCPLVQGYDVPPFQNHHIIPVNIIPWELFLALGEATEVEMFVCPWCHAEEHRLLGQEKEAKSIEGWIDWWYRRYNNGTTKNSPS